MTTPPPTGYLPASTPLAGYPPAGRPQHHGRLPGVAIVLGAILAVSVVGGIIALVVLLGNHNPPAPPIGSSAPAATSPASSPRAIGTSACRSCSAATADELVAGGDRSIRLARATGRELQAARSGGGFGGFGGPRGSHHNNYSLGEGLAVDPAPDWSIASSGNDQIVYINSQHDSLFLAAGLPESGSASTSLAHDAVGFSKVFGATDLKFGTLKQGKVQRARSEITTYAWVPFSATLSTQQTTLPVVGLLFALVKQRADYQAFASPFATSIKAFKSTASAANSMINSIINS